MKTPLDYKKSIEKWKNMNQYTQGLTFAERDVVYRRIERVLYDACKKHPSFPSDPVQATAIMAEEAGEAVQAANDVVWHNGDIIKLRKELLHTGAMCVRILCGLDSGDINAHR